MAKKKQPHESRRVFLDLTSLRRDPIEHSKERIWSLIWQNCIPRDGAMRFHRQTRQRPVEDLEVQTFYIVFPAHDTDFSPILRRLEADQLEDAILSEMLQDRLAVFEPYLSTKLGQSYWNAADDFAKRFRLAKSNSLVQVIPAPQEQRAGAADSDERESLTRRILRLLGWRAPSGEAYIVGRESLTVEISRLRGVARQDPNVVGQIEVRGDAYVNRHVRGQLGAVRADPRPQRRVPILEGRNQLEFIIGPNEYDDIRAACLGADDWYRLVVSVPATGPLNAALLDSAGLRMRPEEYPAGHEWNLGPFCKTGSRPSKLVFVSFPPRLLSEYDTPEAPPTISLVGRVLPRAVMDSNLLPAALSRHLGEAAEQITSWIALDDSGGFFLYYMAAREQVFFLNIVDARQTLVRQQGGAAESGFAGFAIQEGDMVEIDKVTYRWEPQSDANVRLPKEVVGCFAPEDRHRKVEFLYPPETAHDSRRWMIGRWQGQTAALAEKLKCVRLFPNNPDALLAQQGTLILEYNGKNDRLHHQYSLTLRLVSPLPLLVRSYAGDWQEVAWPSCDDWTTEDVPGETVRLCRIPSLQLVGLDNGLILGTTLYNVKTCVTP